MAKAKKLPSGNWRAQSYDYTDESGRKKYKSFTAETKKEVEYAAAEHQMSKINKKKVNTLPYGDAVDKYIEDRSSVLSPGTVREYKRSRKKDMQKLMSVRICDLTQDLIQNAVNEEAMTHKPKTVRNMHGLLSAVLKIYRPDFVLNTALPKKMRPQIYVPTDQEVAALMKAVKDTKLEIPVLLAAFGPMRRGEICALEDGDIKGNVVHVSKAVAMDEHHNWITKAPKSYSGDRYIPLPGFVIEKMKGIKGRIVKISPSQVSDRFIDVVKKTGISHCRFHDLRHYHASISHALGIPDQYIMQRGGWGSDAVLKSVYRHTMSDKNDHMIDVANEHFNRIISHEISHEKK